MALYNARHDRAGIRFNLINPETGNRIRMITQDGETGQELERRSLVKGYEFRKGKYLLLSDDDLDSVKVDSSKVMTIEKFVDTASIDPVYYNSAYYLVPDGDAGKDVYAVLREAITKTGKTALSRVVIAQRERTIALRPMGCRRSSTPPAPSNVTRTAFYAGSTARSPMASSRESIASSWPPRPRLAAIVPFETSPPWSISSPES